MTRDDPRTTKRRTVLKAAGLAAGATLTPLVGGASAATCDFGGGAEVGQYTVYHRDADGNLLDTFEAPDGEELDVRIEPENAGAVFEFRGKYVEFDMDLDTLAVYDYGFTAEHPLMTEDQPVTIFAEKKPLHGTTLDDEVRLSLDSGNSPGGGRGRVRRDSSGGAEMSVQTKDHTQGGIFQMEPEPGMEFYHELAEGLHYFYDDQGQVLLTTGPHEATCGEVIARESPENATLVGDGSGGTLEHGDTTSRWQVDSGGRAGFVAGEDA